MKKTLFIMLNTCLLLFSSCKETPKVEAKEQNKESEDVKDKYVFSKSDKFTKIKHSVFHSGMNKYHLQNVFCYDNIGSIILDSSNYLLQEKISDSLIFIEAFWQNKEIDSMLVEIKGQNDKGFREYIVKGDKFMFIVPEEYVGKRIKELQGYISLFSSDSSFMKKEGRILPMFVFLPSESK